MTNPSTPTDRRNIAIVSDLHCGCQLGLCHPDGAAFDNGGKYMPSKLQLTVWSYWQDYWKWIGKVFKGEPYDVVINGDIIDGDGPIHRHSRCTAYMKYPTVFHVLTRGYAPPDRYGTVYRGRFYPREDMDRMGMLLHCRIYIWRHLVKALYRMPPRFYRRRWSAMNDKLVFYRKHNPWNPIK